MEEEAVRLRQDLDGSGLVATGPDDLGLLLSVISAVRPLTGAAPPRLGPNRIGVLSVALSELLITLKSGGERAR